MHPFLIEFGSFRLPTYGVLISTAALVGFYWLLANAKREGLDPDKAGGAAFWGLFAGICGAKLGLILVEYRTYLSDPGQIFTLDFFQAAGVIWAGVLSGMAALLFYARRHRVPTGPLFDAAAIPIPVSQAIGRLGCLMAGCCYGNSCSMPWGIVYHSEEAHSRTGVPLDVSLHPTPLYEFGWNLLVVLPLLLLLRRRPRIVRGELGLAYLGLYGTGRFMIEFFRGDAVRGVWFNGALSTSQLISAAMVPAAVGAWFFLRHRKSQNLLVNL